MALATACVAAGTVQVPEAHRCRPRTATRRPRRRAAPRARTPARARVRRAPRSRRSRRRPPFFEPRIREPAKKRLLGHRGQEREREGGRAPWERDRRSRDVRRHDDGAEPAQERETRRQVWALALERDRDRGQPDRQVRAANNAVRVPVAASAKGRATSTANPHDHHERRRPRLAGLAAGAHAFDARAHGFTSNATTDTTRGSNGA